MNGTNSSLTIDGSKRIQWDVVSLLIGSQLVVSMILSNALKQQPLPVALYRSDWRTLCVLSRAATTFNKQVYLLGLDSN